MKKIFRTLCCLSVLLSSYSVLVAQSEDFRVIGYLPHYRFSSNEWIAYEKLTHLNIAFANPDMEGNLSVAGKDIDPIISSAHAAQAKVLISLAGGALTADWSAAWKHLMKPENRPAFIHKILQYVDQHQLDGIDMDLEWQHVDELYSGFVLELRDSVDQYPDLLLTAALPGTYRYPQISDAAMYAYDFINMMVYDLRGPWDPTNIGPHSPYSFAQSSINYWEEQGMKGKDLTLGVPFYGYDFSNAPTSVSSFTYQAMVDDNPDNAYVDQVGSAYYNGIPTIQQKTDLALRELSGIMMWELGQDHFSELSLLTAIDQIIQGQTRVEQLDFTEYFEVYPNPVIHELRLSNSSSKSATWRFLTLDGKVVGTGTLLDNSKSVIDCQRLTAGMYVLQLVAEDQVISMKVIKS